MSALDYPQLIETALRGVVHGVLRKISDEGLPGEHHLLLTFRTQHPDVGLPPVLAAQYPEEMTIVLQHQFRDLLVTDDMFSVYLRFSGVEHGVSVPFGALTEFADPAANFRLQFRHFSEVEQAAEEGADSEADTFSEGTDAEQPDQEPAVENAKLLPFEKTRKDS